MIFLCKAMGDAPQPFEIGVSGVAQGQSPRQVEAPLQLPFKVPQERVLCLLTHDPQRYIY
jgi:hypothetical protein